MSGRGGKLPLIVERVASAIYKENKGKRGWDAQRALATAISRLQAYGILKKGSVSLTKKGKRIAKKHYGRKAHSNVNAFFTKLKKEGRKK